MWWYILVVGVTVYASITSTLYSRATTHFANSTRHYLTGWPEVARKEHERGKRCLNIADAMWVVPLLLRIIRRDK